MLENKLSNYSGMSVGGSCSAHKKMPFPFTVKISIQPKKRSVQAQGRFSR